MWEMGILSEEKERQGDHTLRAESEKQKRPENKQRTGVPDLLNLGTLLRNMEAGVCLILMNTRIQLLYASPGFYQMLGLEENNWRMPRDLSGIGIHPEDETDYRQRLISWGEVGGAFTHIHRISGDGENWIWRRVRTICLNTRVDGFPVMLEVSTDVSDLIEKETLLRESAERLRVAFGQTPHLLWEVDIRNRTFSRYDVNMQSCLTSSVIENFPDSLIENGTVHPDSAERFRSFAREIFRGDEGGCGNFIMKNQQNSRYEWVSLSYRMVCDRSQTPVKAIGVQEKMPNVTGGFSLKYPRRPLPEAVRHSLLGRVKVDLTADEVLENWTDGMDRTEWTRGYSFSGILAGREDRYMIRGEGNRFEERFCRENLLAAYERGEYWSSREFRRVDAGGNICWMRDTVNLLKDPDTGHILMIACFCESGWRHQWEKLTEEKAEFAEGSSLYTGQTVREIVEALLREPLDSSCALAVISISGGLEKADEGKRPGCRLKDFIATALSLALGADCVLGECGENMILAYFPIPGSRFDIKKRIEDAYAYVRAAMSNLPDMDLLRMVAGVVTDYPQEIQYTFMVRRCSYLCSLWTNSAIDSVVFPEEGDDWIWKNMGNRDGTDVETGESCRQNHTEQESRAVSACLGRMLTASSMEESARGTLGCVGRYYQADRAYILILSADRKTVTLLYEWMDGEKNSIRQTALGLQISHIPVLNQCLEKRSTVFVEKPFRSSGKEEEKWRFMAYMLETEKRPLGFLCVENPGKHLRDDGLLDAVVPYLLKEPARFKKGKKERGGKEEILYEIPNLREFRKAVYPLTSDSCSSMGAAVLDVPNISAINSREGFDYGRQLLANIAETVESIFGSDYFYRIWDAEFAVLLPNTILDVFTARCIRLKTKLQRRYPGQIRIGYTWSDGIFSARNLVHEAQSIMRCETVPSLSEDRISLAANTLLTDTASVFVTKYIPYFQPKIDMRTGDLVGAEALARGIDENGDVVTPDHFIESLEKSGGIRELDLYMLESVFRQMDVWRQKGYPPLNVSVNLSRKTLLGPTALASVLAIQSRYPEVPVSRIELEITETAGNIETATMAEIISRFRGFGIEFGLDDFGSRYANISIFRNIRFRTIKLDRSLVYDLPSNDISKMMVENIASICRNFNMVCVAEGVENQQQEEALLKAGCTVGQGYYYSKPVPAWKLEERYLRQKNMEKAKEIEGGALG